MHLAALNVLQADFEKIFALYIQKWPETAAMALTPQQLIGPCLDKIVDGASGRKYSKLKTDAKVSNLALL